MIKIVWIFCEGWSTNVKLLPRELAGDGAGGGADEVCKRGSELCNDTGQSIASSTFCNTQSLGSRSHGVRPRAEVGDMLRAREAAAECGGWCGAAPGRCRPGVCLQEPGAARVTWRVTAAHGNEPSRWWRPQSFSLLETTSSAFTIKNISRHYAK